MDMLTDILWSILAGGGLGAFIDFLIGRGGQEKAKDFLLKWWVRFDDVHWKNFGREEGLFAGRLIEHWFGKKIWSLRRVIVSVVIFSLCLTIGYFEYRLLHVEQPYLFTGVNLFVNIVPFIIAYLSFSIGISATKFIAFRIAYACGIGGSRNLILFTMMLLINYVMFVVWFPVTAEIKSNLTNVIALMSNVFLVKKIEDITSILNIVGYILYVAVTDIVGKPIKYFLTFSHPIYSVMFHPIGPIVPHSLLTMSLFPSLFRFLLSILFAGSFLLKPLVMRPVSLSGHALSKVTNQSSR